MGYYKGVIRMKQVDLANWASMHGLFDSNKTTDPIRYSTEGMETVTVHVQKAEDIDTLLERLHLAMSEARAKFTGMDENFDDLLIGVDNVLDNMTMKQSFYMQLRLPISPMIEVIIKTPTDEQV